VCQLGGAVGNVIPASHRQRYNHLQASAFDHLTWECILVVLQLDSAMGIACAIEEPDLRNCVLQAERCPDCGSVRCNLVRIGNMAAAV